MAEKTQMPAQSETRQSVEFMAKMMLMKNSKTTGYADSIYLYRKDAHKAGR